MVTDIDVILSATLFPVPKYSGTKANHITHVVYMVKPAHGENIRTLAITRADVFIRQRCAAGRGSLLYSRGQKIKNTSDVPRANPAELFSLMSQDSTCIQERLGFMT